MHAGKIVRVIAELYDNMTGEIVANSKKGEITGTTASTNILMQ
jgi:hypothetical protein